MFLSVQTFIVDTLQSLLEQFYSAGKVSHVSGREKAREEGLAGCSRSEEEGRKGASHGAGGQDRCEDIHQEVHPETDRNLQQQDSSCLALDQNKSGYFHDNNWTGQKDDESLSQRSSAANGCNLHVDLCHESSTSCGSLQGRTAGCLSDTDSPLWHSDSGTVSHIDGSLSGGDGSGITSTRMNTTGLVELHDNTSDSLMGSRTPEFLYDTGESLSDIISPELLSEMEQEDIHAEVQPTAGTLQLGGGSSSDVAMASGTQPVGGGQGSHLATLSQWSRGIGREISEQV